MAHYDQNQKEVRTGGPGQPASALRGLRPTPIENTGPSDRNHRNRQVARGRTDAQIAGQLYISVRTVHTHLDRIRDKTGCRRRADLTRLALQAGLV